MATVGLGRLDVDRYVVVSRVLAKNAIDRLVRACCAAAQTTGCRQSASQAWSSGVRPSICRNTT